MKEYLNYFKILLIITGVFLVLGIGCKLMTPADEVYVRNNAECTTEERVFDYANKLTDDEEEALRAKIAEAELKIGADIVIVTLNESLADYAKSYEPIIGPVEPYQYTMVYADNFYDEHAFGFDQPYGDGVLLLDNWYREADGSVYSWMSTSGKVMDAYSSEMIDDTLNSALEYVDSDPAGAYSYFVDLVVIDMSPMGNLFSVPLLFIMGIIAGVVFLVANLGSKKGSRTTTTVTYVKNGRPEITDKEDIFLTKTVTRRKIQTQSSSGGGGGGHISSGGHSHGGGGHSR